MKKIIVGIATGALVLSISALGTGAALATSPTPSASSSTASSAPSTAGPATPEPAESADAAESSGAVADAPGGHSDPDGVDVNNVGGANEP